MSRLRQPALGGARCPVSARSATSICIGELEQIGSQIGWRAAVLAAAPSSIANGTQLVATLIACYAIRSPLLVSGAALAQHFPVADRWGRPHHSWPGGNRGRRLSVAAVCQRFTIASGGPLFPLYWSASHIGAANGRSDKPTRVPSRSHNPPGKRRGVLFS